MALGLDIAAFNQCLQSDRYRSQIEAANQAARAREVSTTPTFVINGQMITGALPFEQFRSLIETELSSR